MGKGGVRPVSATPMSAPTAGPGRAGATLRHHGFPAKILSPGLIAPPRQGLNPLTIERNRGLSRELSLPIFNLSHQLDIWGGLPGLPPAVVNQTLADSVPTGLSPGEIHQWLQTQAVAKTADRVSGEGRRLLAEGTPAQQMGLARVLLIEAGRAANGLPPDAAKLQQRSVVSPELMEAIQAAKKSLKGPNDQKKEGPIDLIFGENCYGIGAYLTADPNQPHAEPLEPFNALNLLNHLTGGFSNAPVVRRAIASVFASLADSQVAEVTCQKTGATYRYLPNFERTLGYVRQALDANETRAIGLTALNLLIPAFICLGQRGQQLREEFKNTLFRIYNEALDGKNQDLRGKTKNSLRYLFGPECATTWGPDIDVLIGEEMRSRGIATTQAEADFPRKITFDPYKAAELPFRIFPDRQTMGNCFNKVLNSTTGTLSIFLINETPSGDITVRVRRKQKEEQLKQDGLLKRLLRKFQVFGLRDNIEPDNIQPELSTAFGDLDAFLKAIDQLAENCPNKHARINIQIDTGFGTRTVIFTPAQWRNKGNQRFGYRNQSLASAICSSVISCYFPKEGRGRIHPASSDNILWFFRTLGNVPTELKDLLPYYLCGFRANIEDRVALPFVPGVEIKDQEDQKRFAALTDLGTMSTDPLGKLRAFFEKKNIFLIRGGMREAVLAYLQTRGENFCPSESEYGSYIGQDNEELLTTLGQIPIAQFFKEVVEKVLNQLGAEGAKINREINSRLSDLSNWHAFFYEALEYFQTGSRNILSATSRDIIAGWEQRKTPESTQATEGDNQIRRFFEIFKNIVLGCGTTTVNTFNMNMSRELGEALSRRWKAPSVDGKSLMEATFGLAGEAGYSNYFNIPASLATVEQWLMHENAQKMIKKDPIKGEQVARQIWQAAHDALKEVAGTDVGQVGVALVDYFSDIGRIYEVCQRQLDIFSEDSGKAWFFRVLMGLEREKNFEVGATLGDCRIIACDSFNIRVRHQNGTEESISIKRDMNVGGVKIEAPWTTYIGREVVIKTGTEIGHHSLVLDSVYNPVPLNGRVQDSVNIPSYTILNGFHCDNAQMTFMDIDFSESVPPAEVETQKGYRPYYLCDVTCDPNQGKYIFRPDAAYTTDYWPSVSNPADGHQNISGNELLGAPISVFPGKETADCGVAFGGFFKGTNIKIHKHWPMWGSGLSVEQRCRLNELFGPAGVVPKCNSRPLDIETFEGTQEASAEAPETGKGN